MTEHIYSGRAWIIIFLFYLVGLIVGFIRNICVKKLQKESIQINITKNNYLKHIKLKYENLCKLEKNISNSRNFVEKNLMDAKSCGINIFTMKYISRLCNGMVIYLGMLFAGYAYIKGEQLRSTAVALYGWGSVAMSFSLLLMECVWMTDMRLKKTLINISAYLDSYKDKTRIDIPALSATQIKPKSNYIEEKKMISSNDDIKLIYERESSDNKLIEEILSEYLC